MKYPIIKLGRSSQPEKLFLIARNLHQFCVFQPVMAGMVQGTALLQRPSAPILNPLQRTSMLSSLSWVFNTWRKSSQVLNNFIFPKDFPVAFGLCQSKKPQFSIPMLKSRHLPVCQNLSFTVSTAVIGQGKKKKKIRHQHTKVCSNKIRNLKFSSLSDKECYVVCSNAHVCVRNEIASLGSLISAVEFSSDEMGIWQMGWAEFMKSLVSRGVSKRP